MNCSTPGFPVFHYLPQVSLLVAQLVKNLPAVQKTWIWSLGWEDSLETGTASHFSILAWRIPWTEVPGRLPSPCGRKWVRHDWATNTPHSHLGSAKNNVSWVCHYHKCKQIEKFVKICSYFMCNQPFCIIHHQIIHYMGIEKINPMFIWFMMDFRRYKCLFRHKFYVKGYSHYSHHSFIKSFFVVAIFNY